MYNETVETVEYKGHEIKIYQDLDPENPCKGFDMLSQFVCWHRNYQLGHEHNFDQPSDVEAYAKETDSILLPIYMYEHSGITVKTTPFSCPWDSGQVGYILLDKEKIMAEYGRKRWSKSLKNKVIEIAVAELSTYDDYVTSNVYGFNIDFPNDEDFSSCWGFYGYDHEASGLLERAKNDIDYVLEQNKKAHFEQLKCWIKSGVSFEYRQALSLA